ncbi:hypothetical protein ACFE04_021032 [Oxalis oulophora]
MVLIKLADWVLYKLLANSFYKAAKNLTNYSFLKSSPPQPNINNNNYNNRFTYFQNKTFQTLVTDIDGALLNTTSHGLFPFFMLVAFEAGSIIRALILLLSLPILLFLDYQLKMKVMIFISFCGLKVKDVEIVVRSVLPKFYLENLNAHSYELWSKAESRFVFTSVPRVMVEGFVKEYLGGAKVVGTELQTVGKYFTGMLNGDCGLVIKHVAVKQYFGDKKPDIAIASSSLYDNLFTSLCKEAYIMTKDEINTTLTRQKYPKPLIFHDGRLAFLPTPLATLSMFIWFPIGIFLSVFRLFIGIFLPYKVSIILAMLTGLDLRIKGSVPKRSSKNKGFLYVCTHRTLLDPVFLSTSLQKPLTAVTYSLSKLSEVMAPIKTVRLTRDRKIDGSTMERLLSEGDLVVCPEGTTCREPYLLRFSSLFAELADEIVPVAINTHVSMFYGTTASGLKCLDPFFFLMNPRPSYHVEILEKLPEEMTCGRGGKSSCDVANYIQRQLGDALGFECTNFTRRDKYLMLAGNEGVVHATKQS